MFEEVPRTRRGLAAYLGVSRLTARRIVLGPFVIGGGVVLAAVGGSVAVAATVFTASTIHASDVPPHPHPEVAAVSASASSSASHRSPQPSPSTSSTTEVSAAPVPSTSAGPSSSAPRTSSHPSSSSTESAITSSTTTSVSRSPSASSSASASASASPSSAGSPTATPSPAGNALVYVSGWNPDRKVLLFEFAAVSKGTGSQHSDVYSIASPKQFTATLATDIRIVSGGQLCPPAGSYCSTDQLITGAASGFYAEIAVDPTSAVHEVLERDNVQSSQQPVAPTPTATTVYGPAPSSTSTP